MQLKPWAFGLALWILWAATILLIGICGYARGYCMDFIDVLSGVYLGYAATVQGMFIWALWALVGWFVFWGLLACVYNFLLKNCPICKIKK